jgi:hypothetical protein
VSRPSGAGGEGGEPAPQPVFDRLTSGSWPAASPRRDRRAFARYLWTTWAPGWTYSDADFDQTARSWDNPGQDPDHDLLLPPPMGEQQGDPAHTPIDAAFAAGPPARVPTLMLHGSRDGANPSMTSQGHDDRFIEKYQRVVIEDAGHLLP